MFGIPRAGVSCFSCGKEFTLPLGPEYVKHQAEMGRCPDCSNIAQYHEHTIGFDTGVIGAHVAVSGAML